MMTGLRRRGSAVLGGLLAAVVIMGFVPATHSTPPPTTLAPGYSPPPREESPFSEPDAFCVPSDNRLVDVAPTDPTLRDHPVTVVLLTAARGPDFATAVTQAADAQTFASAINRCGGIGGRRFDLRVVAGTGVPSSDCATAVTQFHPLIVISTVETGAQGCIVHDQRTILITASDAANADFAGSSGRLVATGSSEGVERARLLDLVASGRLDGRGVAIAAGVGPGAAAFEALTRTALATRRIHPVELQRATVVLAPMVEVADIPQLTAATAAARHHQPLDLYGFSPATPLLLDQVNQLGGGDVAHVLRSANVYSFTPVTDSQYRAERSPNTFSEMCNQTYAAELVARASSPTTTTAKADSASSPAYLQAADMCLVMRIAARGLFDAGANLDPTTVISALHRLPYLDAVGPGGTPKPRPNQVVNEPVTRNAQVVVLSEMQSSCPTPSPPPATTAAVSGCWVPVSGWDDGGRVVNAPRS